MEEEAVVELWDKIAEVLKNFWPAYIILPLLLFFRDQIKNWFYSRYKKGVEQLEEEKFDQHAAKYEQRWTKELQLAKKISADSTAAVENRLSGEILDLEQRIEVNKEADVAFQKKVTEAFEDLGQKLDLIQKTQNKNCDNMGKKLESFEKKVSSDLGSLTKGVLSVQQSDLERTCLDYQQKGGMTTKEKRDFEKRWNMYKSMGGDDLEWVKEAITNIPIVNY